MTGTPCARPASTAYRRRDSASPAASRSGGARPSMTARSSAWASAPSSPTTSISARTRLASGGSRAASTAAARACARMLNSFCVTASCRSRASRDRSCTTDSSRLRSYSRALVSAIAACAANRERISSSRSVNPRFSAAAETLLAAKMMPRTWSPSRTGTPRKCDILRVRGRPALEPGVLADIREPFRLALVEQHGEHPVPPRQRADRRPLGVADPVHHELGERVALIGHAERGVARADQGPGRAHDHLQHVADGHLPGDGQHRLAHLVQLVESFAHGCSDVSSCAGGLASGRGLRTIGAGRAGLAADVPGRALPSVGWYEHSIDNGSLPRSRPGPGGRPGARGLRPHHRRAGRRRAGRSRGGAACSGPAAQRPGGTAVTAVPGDVTDPAHRAALLAAALPRAGSTCW